MTNIFKILNAKLNSGNNKAIGKVRDRLEHARANAVKDRVVVKSGTKFTGLSVNTSCDVPAPAAALVIQRAWRLHDASRRDDTANAVFLRSLANGTFVNKWQRIAASIVIQGIWRGSSSRKRAVIARGRDACARIVQMAIREYRFKMLRAKRAVQIPAAVILQCIWRGRAAKNTAAMLIKEQKKSTAQLAVKGRSSRKRKLVASSFKDCRKRVRNNALARDRHAKRKRTQVQNARAAKRFRDFIEYVRFSTSDTVIEDFEFEVLNGGVIDDVRMDHADTYESDSE